MTILNVRDENTGEFVAVDVDAPSGNLYIRDADTGEFLLLDLSAPTGIVKVIDANTGEFVSIDYATPSGTLNVIDPNTGEFLAIDLASPVGTLYNLDDKTGEFVQLDISTAKFFKSSNVVLGGTPAPTYETPSYANAGGTGARQTTRILVTNGGGAMFWAGSVPPSAFVNGVNSESTFFFDANPVAGLFIQFKLVVPAIITEAKWYQQNTASHGVWKWQGSNNGTDWADIGSTFTLGGGATQTQTSLSANITPYLYYRMLGVSGNLSASPYLYEIEFKIGNSNAPANASWSVYSILTLGDSKSSQTIGYQPRLIRDLNIATLPSITWVEATPRSATSGWNVAQLHTAVDSTIASVTPAPQYALVNIGTNDAATTEANFKADLQGVIDGVHGQFPACQIYIMRIWRQGAPLVVADSKTWTDAVIALNSSFVHAGPDEGVFLEGGDDGVTYTSDGIHPTEPAGYQLTADQWRAVLGH